MFRITEYLLRLKLSHHVLDTVGLSYTNEWIATEILSGGTQAGFQLHAQEAIEQGISIRVLPNQGLVFELNT